MEWEVEEVLIERRIQREREREIPLEQTKVLFENAMILGFHSIECTKLK